MDMNLLKIFTIGLSLIVSTSLFAGNKVVVAENDEIVISFIDSLPPVYIGGENPESAENYRFYTMSKIIKDAFLDAGLSVEVVRNGSKEVGDINVNVALVKWDLNKIAEYECRLGATASKGDEFFDFGVFVGTLNAIPFTSDPKYTYNIAAEKAVNEMVKHFVLKE